MPDRGTTIAIFFVPQLQKYIAANKLFYIAIVGIEKDFDHAPRKVLLRALRSLNVEEFSVFAYHPVHLLQRPGFCAGQWSVHWRICVGFCP